MLFYVPCVFKIVTYSLQSECNVYLHEGCRIIRRDCTIASPLQIYSTSLYAVGSIHSVD